MIYFDNSATTKPLDEVVVAMTKALTTDFGNPSSLYSLGLDAEKIIKSSRAEIAKSISASPEEIFFTSCGTESDNTAVFGVWNSRKKLGNRIICSAVEHPAVLRCFEKLENEGADVVYIPVHKDGSLDYDAFLDAINDDTILVSIMHVNNESGAIFPIEDIAKEVRKHKNCILHSDCVQSYGKLPIDVHKLGADMISLSAHKIHGPKGIGALYIKNGLHIPSFIYGGGQESSFRSGTENVACIAGFGSAAKNLTMVKPGVKDYLRSRLIEEIDDIKINTPEASAPSVLNVSFLGTRAEVILHMLEDKGIYVSTGSACSSKKKGSHVLSAMGLSDQEMEGAIRFSFGFDNTNEEADTVVEELKSIVSRQRLLQKAMHSKK